MSMGIKALNIKWEAVNSRMWIHCFFRYPIKCPLLVDIIKERDHKMGDAANNIYLIVV